MKKFLLSMFVFLASAGYIAYQYMGGGATSAALATTTPTPSTTQHVVANDQTGQVQVVPSSTPPLAQTTTIPTPVPVTKPKGQYADGAYTGSSVSAYYGTVQVQAIIQGGKLVTVNFLQYPTDRRTSQYINGSAMPELQSEAIQAQSAQVNGVSGATDTSQAFIQSLGSALAQAKNS